MSNKIDENGRDKDVLRKVNLRLKDKRQLIPRDENDNPAFDSLEEVGKVFEPFEILALVNKSLYQLEYQADSHKKYHAKRQEMEKPFKEMAKRMFPGTSWINLTEEQVAKVILKVKEERGT